LPTKQYLKNPLSRIRHTLLTQIRFEAGVEEMMRKQPSVSKTS